MKIAELNQEEQGLILKATHPTKYSTLTVLKALEAMHTANFEENLKSVIESLEEQE